MMTGLGVLASTRLTHAASGKQGQDVEIAPTMLALGDVGATAVCTIFNNGTAPTSSQIRIKAWSQAGGQDVLGDTGDIVASPPFMTVAPNQQQIVRVANLSAQAGATELSYRLLLNQLPSPGSLTGNGIQMLLAFSVPLFIAGADASPAEFQAQFLRGADGIILRLHNSGDVHARLVNLTYESVGGASLMTLPGLSGYVLARSSRDFDTRLTGLPPSGGRLLSSDGIAMRPLPATFVSSD